MLLQHGANPNANFSHADPRFTTLYLILAFPLNDCTIYAQALIKHNANPNRIHSIQGEALNNHAALKAGSVLRTTIKKVNASQDKKIYIGGKTERVSAVLPIIIVSEDRNTILFKAFLPSLDILNLACCLADISTKNQFKTRKMLSQTPDVLLTSFQALPSTSGSLTGPFISWYIFPTQASEPVDTQCIADYSIFWNLAQQEFIKKMKSPLLTPLVFDRIYTAVFESGKGLRLNQSYFLAYNSFVACEILLSERCKNLSQQTEQKNLLIKHIPELTEEICTTIPLAFKSWDVTLITNTQCLFRRRSENLRTWLPQHVPLLSFSADASSLQTASTAEPTTEEEETKKTPENKNEKPKGK